MKPHTHPHYRSRQSPLHGFTLLEVLIVVVLLGIIAMLVLPLFGDQDGDRVRSAARLLVSDLEYAQLCSIGDGADPCSVVFDLTAHRYHLARRSTPMTPITHPGTGEEYITDFGDSLARALVGVRIDSIEEIANDQILFTSFGSLDQFTDAAVVLRCGERTVRIVIDSTTGEPWLD